jgi:hypothetical protein
MKKNTNEDTINIYWAPLFNELDWNMMYPEPINLFNDMNQYRTKGTNKFGSFYMCPAVSDRMKRTFVFKNSLETEIDYDFTDLSNPIVQTVKGIKATTHKPSSMVDKGYIESALSYIFFAEESVLALMNVPTVHRPKYFNQGMLLSGSFDISRWFRPMSAEFQMWEQKGKLILEEDEPLFYLELITDKKINLQRFNMTEKLYRLSYECVRHSKTFGAFKPIQERYRKFEEAKMNEIVLTEIKKNLIGQQ